VSAYAFVLFLHSALRWAVLVATFVALVRALAGWRGARPWTRPDDVVGATTVGLLDLQFVLGLVLYAFLSPASRAFFADPGAAMANAGLRFFGMEHAFAMVVALVIGHLGRVLSRRVSAPAQRHRNAFVSALAVLVVLLIGIPWPFLPYGRPLLRGL
jgi:hypothetical protein